MQSVKATKTDLYSGVFPKTMRNMWILVTVFNPTIALLSIAVVPIDLFPIHQNNILSIIAEEAAGKWLRILVAVDAGLVLCGGVLTAFVGVGGLMERLASDRYVAT